MSEFNVRQHATFSPTRCALCGTHEGPFIDTHLDLPAYGHVWICMSNGNTSGCARQLGELDGMIHPEIFAELTSDMEELVARLADLQEKLEARKVNLSLAEIRELIGG